MKYSSISTVSVLGANVPTDLSSSVGHGFDPSFSALLQSSLVLQKASFESSYSILMLKA